eukprot:2197379-Rhodomonas_salina.1
MLATDPSASRLEQLPEPESPVPLDRDKLSHDKPQPQNSIGAVSRRWWVCSRCDMVGVVGVLFLGAMNGSWSGFSIEADDLRSFSTGRSVVLARLPRVDGRLHLWTTAQFSRHLLVHHFCFESLSGHYFLAPASNR